MTTSVGNFGRSELWLYKLVYIFINLYVLDWCVAFLQCSRGAPWGLYPSLAYPPQSVAPGISDYSTTPEPGRGRVGMGPACPHTYAMPLSNSRKNTLVKGICGCTL